MSDMKKGRVEKEELGLYFFNRKRKNNCPVAIFIYK